MSPSTIVELDTGQANVIIGSTGDKGRGVIARRALAAGERIFTVTGLRTHQRTRYTVQLSHGVHIEPGGPAKFLNHSCEPNAGVRTREDGRPDIVAMGPIAAGEEITVDYAMFEYVVGPSSEGSCLCGTPACRGRITGFRDTNAAWRLKYSHWTAAYLTEDRQAAAA
jgi:uncharacterized protein